MSILAFEKLIKNKIDLNRIVYYMYVSKNHSKSHKAYWKIDLNRIVFDLNRIVFDIFSEATHDKKALPKPDWLK